MNIDEKNSKTITKNTLMDAAKKSGCKDDQIDEIWENLNNVGSKSNPINVIYYFGALIVFTALAWLLGTSQKLYGKEVFFYILLSYTLLFYTSGIYFWKAKKQSILGGVFFFLSLSLIPLITYAGQVLLDWWPGNFPGRYEGFFALIKGGWFLMEVTTILFTSITLRFFRFPSLTAILYLTLWFMSLDTVPFFITLLKKNSGLITQYSLITMTFGSLVSLFAFILERKNKKAFAFWAFIFGIGTFWIGVNSRDWSNELGYLFSFFVNATIFLSGAALIRKSMAIIGTFGIILYFYNLYYRHFQGSKAFPLVVSAAGLGIIFLGILLQKQKKFQFLKNKA